jgi:hypothetical protein
MVLGGAARANRTQPASDTVIEVVIRLGHACNGLIERRAGCDRQEGMNIDVRALWRCRAYGPGGGLKIAWVPIRRQMTWV